MGWGLEFPLNPSRSALAVYLCGEMVLPASPPFHRTLPAIAWRATADRAGLGA